jgi:hypothetical protein
MPTDEQFQALIQELAALKLTVAAYGCITEALIKTHPGFVDAAEGHLVARRAREQAATIGLDRSAVSQKLEQILGAVGFSRGR